MSGQRLQAKLASNHITNSDHGVFDIVDVLNSTLGFFLCHQFRDQRLHAFLNRLVSCHPWLLCLI
jgi:hypothetical protein